MKELENKIREALPRLKELTDGAIVYKPHFNVFSQKYDEDVFDEIEYKFGKFFENGEELEYFKLDSDYIIGHPIKLNDVLEYIKIKDIPIYNTTEINTIAFGVFPKIQYWDLSSVFLADQSEELKEFLNSL